MEAEVGEWGPPSTMPHTDFPERRLHQEPWGHPVVCSRGGVTPLNLRLRGRQNRASVGGGDVGTAVTQAGHGLWAATRKAFPDCPARVAGGRAALTSGERLSL